MQRLDGEHVALTGAAGGIGSLVAAGLQRRGAVVTGIDRVPSPACDRSIVADLASEEGLDALCARLAQDRVDILTNIAGVQYFGPAEAQDSASLRLCYAVNLIAPATLIRAVLPQMQARGCGQIVNIGSVFGSINYPYFASYSSSKAGLKGLSEGLRRELKGSGVTVTYVAPRAVRTAFNTSTVNDFMAITGIKADEPEVVAARIVDAIVARRAEVTIGWPERFFVRLNALLPRLVDRGLAGQAARARMLFTH